MPARGFLVVAYKIGDAVNGRPAFHGGKSVPPLREGGGSRLRTGAPDDFAKRHGPLNTVSRRRRAGAALLASVPIVMLTIAVPFANRVPVRIGGFPFLLFWIVLWVLLTPAVLYAVSRLEDR